MSIPQNSNIHQVRGAGTERPKPGRPLSQSRQETVARLAYALWERRGADSRGPGEQDWRDSEAVIAFEEELSRAARAS